MNEKDSIWVLTVPRESVAELGPRMTAAPERVLLEIDRTGSKVSETLKKVSKIFANVTKLPGQFFLNEVKFSLEISAEGKVSLLGTGIGVGTVGAIELTLVRKKERTNKTKQVF